MGNTVQSGRGVWKGLFKELRPYFPHILLLFVISVLATPLSLISPLPLKIIVDNVLGSQPLSGYLTMFAPQPISLSYLIILAIGILLAAAVLSQLQSLSYTWLNLKVGQRITIGLRTRLFSYMQRLSITYHDMKGTTDSVYRIQYDAPAIQNFAINGLLPLITSIIMLFSMIVVIAFLDWELAIVALLISPALFLLAYVYRKKLRKKWREAANLESSAMKVAQESLGAIRIVKAFGQEDRENERFISHSNESMSASVKANIDQGVYTLIVGSIIAAGMAAVLFIGIGHVQSGVLSLGDLLMVNYYLTQLYSPMKTIGSQVMGMQKQLASAERIFSVLNEKPDVTERTNALPLNRAKGKIGFQNVSFEYEKGHPVLKDVSFQLKAGTTIGVLGATGSGKTTLSNLMLRFFDPSEGKITLDDIDLKDYKVADLRNQYAVVLQDTVLFSTTIAENIRFARPQATLDEIKAAAKAANAHEFVSNLPRGYDTLVGERGMRLSGGERQRISIARAFLKNAPLLILDEPTSALDIQTEEIVMKAVQRLMRGRTSIMIAHRLTTLKNCDILLTLEHGNVKEITHNVKAAIHDMLEQSIATPEKKELID